MDVAPVPTAHERGFGLIEVLITIAIVSIAFVALLSAMGTMIVAGAQHRELTRTEALARNAAEYVKSSVIYTDCAMSYTLTGLPIADPSQYTAAVTSVKVWNGADPAVFTPSVPGCSDTGVQQVTVTVARTGGVSQAVTVVKREA